MTFLVSVFLLLIAFQIKHFLADYIFQNGWMVRGKHAREGWVGPLAAHAGVHAAMTWSIALVWTCHDDRWSIIAGCFGVAALDLVVHFTMDRIKASPNLLGRWKAMSAGEYRALMDGRYYAGAGERRRKVRGNTLFWWSLGLDQAVHHLTHYAIIWFLVR